MATTPATRASLLVRLADPADRAAWEEFLTVYGPLVHAAIRRRGFDHPDADDLTQKVFARVFRGLRTFEYDRRRGRFRDWLGAILRHEVIREFRTRSRQPASLLPPDELDSLSDDAVDPEWADAFQVHLYQVALARCRGRFQPQTWAAFEQVWVAGRAPSDVAQELGLPVETVYVAKSRVLGVLSRTILELSDDLPRFSDGP